MVIVPDPHSFITSKFETGTATITHANHSLKVIPHQHGTVNRREFGFLCKYFILAVNTFVLFMIICGYLTVIFFVANPGVCLEDIQR